MVSGKEHWVVTLEALRNSGDQAGARAGREERSRQGAGGCQRHLGHTPAEEGTERAVYAVKNGDEDASESLSNGLDLRRGKKKPTTKP